MLAKTCLAFLCCISLLSFTGCIAEPTNQSPVAVIDASATNGEAPLTVTFNGSRSSDPDGTIVDYRWDLGDGNTKNGVSVTHTYSQAGAFTVRLTVTDDQGASGEAIISITARKPDCPRDSTDNGKLRLTLRSVSVADEIEIWKPDEGNRFVIIDVMMEALADNQLANPFLFKLEEEDGTVHTFSIASGALPRAFESATLDRGQKTGGQIAFEVRLQARQLRLHYEPLFDSNKMKLCFSIP